MRDEAPADPGTRPSGDSGHGHPAAVTQATPVLEIGGTHVTAAVVANPLATPRVVNACRFELSAADPAAAVVSRLLEAARSMAAPEAARWGVAIPGPFDYERGIGRFTDVGKFDALNGYHLGEALEAQLGSVRFLNDADAFGIGEYAAGAARGHARSVCLTLGTGIGSAFIADGVPVNEGDVVPPDGSAHLLTWQGQPLEATVSRRALRRRYREATGELIDVQEIAERARQGDGLAREVFDTALRALGAAMAPWVDRFAASVLVVGGSIAGSWDLVAAPLGAGLADAAGTAPAVLVRPAEHPHDAPLFGAARWAAN